MVHINSKAIIVIFAIILFGFIIAFFLTEYDTRPCELRILKGFVKEIEISNSVDTDNPLERLFINDETVISIEKKKTLLAFHYTLNNKEKLDDSYQDFRDAYFKMAISNRADWAKKFKQSPEFDFKKGNIWYGTDSEIKGECIVEEKKGYFCIFIPLRDAFDGEEDLDDFYIRLYFDSLFELKDKLITNKIIFNIYIQAGSNIPEHLKENAGGFMVFFPMDSEVSYTFGDPKLLWEPEISSLALIYFPDPLSSSPPHEFASLNESFIIKVNSRSYFVAIWGLITSIIFSIVFGYKSLSQ